MGQAQGEGKAVCTKASCVGGPMPGALHMFSPFASSLFYDRGIVIGSF